MKIKGFTPVFDNLVVKYEGTATALVYGKIWRYCEWSDLGLCTVSNKRLAKELGLGESTIRRAKEVLEKDEFIKKTGRKGGTDSVAVLHNLVMELYGPGDNPATDDQPSATDERTTPLKSSDKDSSSKRVKQDIIAKDPVTAAVMGKPNPLEGYPPDIVPLLEAFIDVFKRNPSASEKAHWIKVARQWREMGVKPQNVVGMYQHTRDQDLAIKSPASITFAYDELRAGKQEDPLKGMKEY